MAVRSTAKVAVHKKANGTYVLTERAVPGYRLADSVKAARTVQRSAGSGRFVKRSAGNGRFGKATTAQRHPSRTTTKRS